MKRLSQTFAKMKAASMIYWNIIGILAEENSLLVVGGVEKLLFEDYFSSLVTTKVEIVGCNDISVPDYPSHIFGPSLLQFKVIHTK